MHYIQIKYPLFHEQKYVYYYDSQEYSQELSLIYALYNSLRLQLRCSNFNVLALRSACTDSLIFLSFLNMSIRLSLSEVFVAESAIKLCMLILL
jgi:hypothetical protein